MNHSAKTFAKPVTSTAVVDTANSTVNGTAIDTSGWDALLLALVMGTKSDGTIAVKLQHSDASGSGFADLASPYDVLFTSVADGAAGSATAQYTAINLRQTNVKRYVRSVITVASNAGICNVGVVGFLVGPKDPTTQANTGWDKTLPS